MKSQNDLESSSFMLYGFDAHSAAGAPVLIHRRYTPLNRFHHTIGGSKMMSPFFARKMNADGRFYYGLSCAAAPDLGPLYEFIVEGEGKRPAPAPNPATPWEHAQWMASLQRHGFRVVISWVQEPRITR
jgi:hypothetical protein